MSRWQEAKEEAKRLAEKVSLPSSRGEPMELREYAGEEAYRREQPDPTWPLSFFNQVQRALKRELRRKGYAVETVTIED